MLLFGLMALFSSLGKPGVEALRAVDSIGLIASGACLGVAIVGLLGRLRIRDE